MADAEILCVGELLWDALPAGLFLGGAPFNVACHLRAAGHAVALVSRVGSDMLGDEARRRVAQYGVATDLLQTDPALPTGFVRVTVDDAGETSFDIVEPAAWDAIGADEVTTARATTARAIVFGTLAQRQAVSRRSIERLLDGTALKVLDVNLRSPYENKAIVERSLRLADVVTMNEREMRVVARWFGLRGREREIAHGIADAFGCRVVCITRGTRGAALLREGRWAEHDGFEVEVRDTVGAGDAFLAVFLSGLLGGLDDAALLQHANLIGAYVVTQSGAVPADQPLPPIRSSGAAPIPRSRSRPRDGA